MKLDYSIKRELVKSKIESNTTNEKVSDIYRNAFDRKFVVYNSEKANIHPHGILAVQKDALEVTKRVASLYLSKGVR